MDENPYQSPREIGYIPNGRPWWKAVLSHDRVQLILTAISTFTLAFVVVSAIVYLAELTKALVTSAVST